MTVKSREDIFPYLINISILERKIIDFNTIMTSFDGMELIHGHDGKNFMDLHYNEFYAWDVDSIVIWNPYIIVPMNKVGKEAA